MHGNRGFTGPGGKLSIIHRSDRRCRQIHCETVDEYTNKQRWKNERNEIFFRRLERFLVVKEKLLVVGPGFSTNEWWAAISKNINRSFGLECKN